MSSKSTAQDKSLHRDGFHKSEQLFRETSFRSWCQSLHIDKTNAKKKRYEFSIDHYEQKHPNIIYHQDSLVNESNVDDDDDNDKENDQIDDSRLLMLMYDLNQTRTMPRSNSVIF